jgi:hypothetical protein
MRDPGWLYEAELAGSRHHCGGLLFVCDLKLEIEPLGLCGGDF